VFREEDCFLFSS